MAACIRMCLEPKQRLVSPKEVRQQQAKETVNKFSLSITFLLEKTVVCGGFEGSCGRMRFPFLCLLLDQLHYDDSVVLIWH